MRVDGIFPSAFFRPGGYANAKPGSIGRRRRPIAFPCRSGKLRQKIFSGLARTEKSFLAKTLHATFRSNRRRGRETAGKSENRRIAVWHRLISAIILISELRISHGSVHMGRNFALASGRQVLSGPRGRKRRLYRRGGRREGESNP